MDAMQWTTPWIDSYGLLGHLIELSIPNCAVASTKPSIKLAAHIAYWCNTYDLFMFAVHQIVMFRAQHIKKKLNHTSNDHELRMFQ